MNDALLSTLKTIGAIIAALYGVYATVTDFKVEKDGKKKLSGAGWIGLFILLIATILNLSTDFVSRQQDARQHAIESRERDKQERDVALIGDNLSTELAQTVALNHGLAETSREIKGNVQISRKNAAISSESLAQTLRVLDPIRPTISARITLRIPRHQQAVKAFAQRIDLDTLDPNSLKATNLIIEGSEDWPIENDPNERTLFSFLHEMWFTVSFKTRATPPQDYNLRFSGGCEAADISKSPAENTSWPSLSIFPNHDLRVTCVPTLQVIGDDPDLKSYQDLLGKSAEIGFEPYPGANFNKQMQLAIHAPGVDLRNVVFSIESFTLSTPDNRDINLQGLNTHACPSFSSCTTSLPIVDMSVQRDIFTTALRKRQQMRARQKRRR